MNDDSKIQAHEALNGWSRLGPFELEQVPIGLLNHTFRVKARSGSYILQRLSPVFAPVVNQDIDALTRHLHAKGVTTPLLVANDQKGLWSMRGADCWRLQTLVAGDTFHEIQNPRMAGSAGECVGRFHVALADFEHVYAFSRPGAHDTQRFLSRLEAALEAHRTHPNFEKIVPLAQQLLRAGKPYGDYSHIPRRHSHGDLKISNVLFAKEEAHCLIDLDTIGLLPWPVEMGDAFRSWCNSSGEDANNVAFDTDIFAAALHGYASTAKHLWTQEEKESLIQGVLNIPLELSTRFLLDALEESYFAWDKKRFVSHSAHNLVRAQGQWALFEDIERKKQILSQQIYEAFA